MGVLEMKAHGDKETILKELIQIISDIMQDAEVEFSGAISGNTCLIADLGFQSLDLVVLIGEIRSPHRSSNLRNVSLELEPFILSREQGDDIRVSDLVEFLYNRAAVDLSLG